jgi:hypothetical protein
VFLAEGTVKNYVSRIMDKLHARNRIRLAVLAEPAQPGPYCANHVLADHQQPSR